MREVSKANDIEIQLINGTYVVVIGIVFAGAAK
jgi:hypothetical protein